MTFAIGQTNGRRAFTLIELILVLTLLAILASFIAPSLSNFVHGRALDSEARRLLSLTRAAQSRAVGEGMPMVLWLDATKGAYGLEQEATSQSNDPKAIDFTVDEHVQLQVVNAATSATMFQNRPAIRFLPEGTIDENSPAILRLADSTGAMLWLIQSRNRMGYEIRNTDK